jgi:dUTP pyrophosphatase
MDNNTIFWAKVKPDAKIPTKRDEDGWYDIYACFEEDYIEIPPHSTKLIPTGIASAVSSKWKISLGERGTNIKSCSILQAGKIDSGYRGEWFVAIYNGNTIPIVISKDVDNVEKTILEIKVPYSKAVCQAEITEVPKLTSVEISYDELLTFESERGKGALGSSGK